MSVLSFSPNQGWRKCVLVFPRSWGLTVPNVLTVSRGWEMPMTGQLVCKNNLFIHMHFFRKPLCVNMHIPQLGTEIQAQSPLLSVQVSVKNLRAQYLAFWENSCSKALGTNSFSQPKILGSRFSLHICTACACCVWPRLIPGIGGGWLLSAFRSNPLLGHCLLLQLCLLPDPDSISLLFLPYIPVLPFPSRSPHSGWLFIGFNSVLLLSTKTTNVLLLPCVSTDCQLNLVLQVKCQWAVLLEGRVGERCPLEVWDTEDGRSIWVMLFIRLL